MKRHILSALAAVGMLAGSIAAANAVGVCAPSEAGKVLGPARVVAPSGAVYTTNNRGCADAPAPDAVGLVSKGFTFEPAAAVALLVHTPGGSVTIPAGATIVGIAINEVSGAAVTGGVSIGTTSGARNIVSGFVCAANCFVGIPDASIINRTFSQTTAQQIFFSADSNWNSGPGFNAIVYYRRL